MDKNSYRSYKSQKMKEISSNEVEYSVFCIESNALKLGISGDETYQLLTEGKDILDEYIIPSYECFILRIKNIL